jgi:formiminoglutamase
VEGLRSVHLVGAHTYATSVTPRAATPTPPAIRAALDRFSTYCFDEDIDLLELVRIVDHGDVADPDTDGAAALDGLLRQHPTSNWILLGGDNALTWRGMRALAGDDLASWGLITFDAHLDRRDGVSNGSPVRQLLEEGLDGRNVVQIGLNDFSNSASYARAARESGATLFSRGDVTRRSIDDVVAAAVDIAGRNGRPVYVDVDVDVCDRSVVPGCPAAAPGGFSAEELRRATRLVASEHCVRAIDVTEIDVTRDSSDERTVRLAALLVLEAATGFARRV